MVELEKTVDTLKVEAEIGKLMTEASKLTAEAAKLNAETMKLNAEAFKLQRESRWYPVIWATAFVGAVIGVARFLH
ncbi:hypothetical protein [Burkholderia pseudomallei]|uniref:hypothetical protein n=1 Tax=Burkholderia pseudomallei TaxID=28450 RepID=UPI00016B04F3|nr:hypothetical protein [Burkholderia pseudomallei]AHK67864.1 hypothetical protein BBX_4065 [Burkholderia pseudomallei MSHR520]KGV17429.1 hypothetical protein X895_3643 [Burkholderia pseudomallei MSHR4503]AGR69219.1 hypothetical protein BDL_4903 [Burkholderia pseudomallei MSHR305]AGZ32443.1 hypothetical protein BBK_4206 [Burkholderia pseudomallei NCTC 13179]AIP82525.1 hypothetical protein JE55_6062 [Burkholderia pseudomallei]